MKLDIAEIIHGKAHVTIGKNMITPAVIEQITTQFYSRKFLKIKFLELPEEVKIKEISEELALLVAAKVRDSRGKTCIIEDLKNRLKKKI
jgi:RNA-binding protein YhbY